MTDAVSSPATPPNETPVLIAGGGPVGLAVAVELAHHRIASVLVEPRREVSWLRPRAKTVSARTMEHFRRWGLARRLRDHAPLPVSWSTDAVFCTTVTGREITRFHDCFGMHLTGDELVAEAGQQAPQPLVEQLLRETVHASTHSRLVTGWRVTGVRQDDDGVSVTVESEQGRTARVRADYVVGCEGSHSVTRDAIGARYQGREDARPNMNITFRAPTLADHVPHGPAVHYWVLNPRQPGVVGRLDLEATWWCIANGVTRRAGEADPVGVVTRMLGAPLPVEIIATDAWIAQMLLVDRYGSGRVFVAGDAAHQNPPWGGHGFNTGIGDAANLGWKIAAVLTGWAPPELLDTYQTERRPVAADTIAAAARNMATLAPELADPRLFGTDDQFAAALPAVRAVIRRTKDSEFHSLDLVLGYRYADSPLTMADRTAQRTLRDDGVPTVAVPGARLPHRWLAPNDSLYDHLGPEFTLIVAADSGTPSWSPPAAAATSPTAIVGVPRRADPAASLDEDVAQVVTAAAELRIPLTVLTLQGRRWLDHFGAPLVLVRPDQHVSWCGDRVTDARRLLRTAVGYPGATG